MMCTWTQASATRSRGAPTQATEAAAQSTTTSATAVGSVSMGVTFYHCVAGTFWNVTSGAVDASEGCELCTEAAVGDVEVSMHI